MSLGVGARLGHYAVTAKLGQGGAECGVRRWCGKNVRGGSCQSGAPPLSSKIPPIAVFGESIHVGRTATSVTD